MAIFEPSREWTVEDRNKVAKAIIEATLRVINPIHKNPEKFVEQKMMVIRLEVIRDVLRNTAESLEPRRNEIFSYCR